MKYIFKSISILFVAALFISCDQDPILYTGEAAPAAYSFSKSSETIGVCEPTVPVTVEVTEAANQDRTVNVSVNSNSTAQSSEYTVANSVTIPAGEYVANLDVTIDFAQIPEGDSRELILDINTPEGSTINTRGSIVVGFSSACTLNEVEFSFSLDDFPEEFAYQVLDATTQELLLGETAFGEFEGVESFSETACLPSGDYLLVLFDAFGDGFCCDFGQGSADITLKACEGDSAVIPTISSEFDAGQLIVPFTL